MFNHCTKKQTIIVDFVFNVKTKFLLNFIVLNFLHLVFLKLCVHFIPHPVLTESKLTPRKMQITFFLMINSIVCV